MRFFNCFAASFTLFIILSIVLSLKFLLFLDRLARQNYSLVAFPTCPESLTPLLLLLLILKSLRFNSWSSTDIDVEIAGLGFDQFFQF